MKPAIVIFIVLLAGGVWGADYVKIDVATAADINKIFFYNDQMGWAVTSGGEVLSTFDAGKNWRIIEVSKRNIRDIQFLNRDGYLIGDRGLLMKSTNGGGSWQDISLNMKYNLTGVGILDDSTIIICGNDQNSISKTKGEVFESRDFGKTWKKHEWRLGNGYTDIAVCPPRKVYLLASKKVFHSISRGIRYFHGGYEGSRLGFGFDFMDDWGFMVGHKGYFARTNSHGRNWEEIPLDSSGNLYAVEMFDKESGVAVGEGGLIMYFYDNGDRQVFEHCGYPNDLLTVFVTGNKVFFGGKGGLLMSTERFPRAEDK